MEKVGRRQPHSVIVEAPVASMQDDRDDSVTVTKIPASAYDRPNE